MTNTESSIPFPALAVGRHGVITHVPSPPRTSWGLTEDEAACGYARCGSGCSAPPVLRVTADEWLCEACADAMQVAGGVA